MKPVYVILITTCMLSTFSSCKKEAGGSTLNGEDNAAIETEMSQVYDVVVDYLATDSKTGKQETELLPDGAIVTFTDSIFSDSDGVACTIDYGLLDHNASYKGIPCRDGRYRAGKIHAAMNHRFSNASNTLLITITSADEYYVGDGTKMYRASGWQTIERTGDSTFTQTVENANMQRENGTASWNCNRVVTLLNPGTASWWNGEYTVSGTANGTNKNGGSFSTSTITPLHKKLELGCLGTFVSGKLDLTSNSELDMVVDYGNGNCDNKTTVSIGSTTKEISVW